MCGGCQPHYIGHVLLEISGESFDTRAYVHCHPQLYFLHLGSFLLFIHLCCLSLAFLNATVRRISLAVTIPPPHLFLLPHSAQIQKNSFHYCCLTKGHICQCGVVSVSTDAFSGPTHPLAVLRVPLSTCPAPPFSLPLWLSDPWHYLSLSSELLSLMTPPSPTQTLIVSFQLNSSSLSTKAVAEPLPLPPQTSALILEERSAQ